MRVTGNRMIDLATGATAAGQTRVASAAQEVTTGLRVTRPSDDPNAYVSAERAKLHKNLVDGSTRAVQTSREHLAQVDGALATVGEALSQIRGLALQGNSATYNSSDRAQMAEQVRTLFTASLGAANIRSAEGEYLLAGTASLTEPFSATGVYSGNAATLDVATSADTSVRATVSGSELTAASGGVDVLPLMSRVATALATNDTATLATTLDELAKAVEQVGLARTRVGGSMKVLESTVTAHAELTESLTKTISNEVEVDSLAAASNLAKTSQALEVSRTVTSHLIALLKPT
jgi:flagellar hook-associated protein 3 FlgL